MKPHTKASTPVRERSLARTEGIDVWLEDHGMITLSGSFQYEEGTAQGFGYLVDADFLKRLMLVFDVEFLQQVNGKSCWATHQHDRITKIEPLHKKGGEAFDIEEWSTSRREP